MINPINTAILSYGMSGEIFHAPLLMAHPGFNLSTVVQRSKETAKHHYPLVRVVRTVEEIFNNAEIELVIVNATNETHFPFAAAALEAGKDVVVEKPFTVTVKEADDLIAIAKKKNKVLTVFQSRRWDGDFLTLKKVIEGNMVGKIVEFEAHYDRFRNYIEPNSWKEEQGPGKGILYNLGSHMLDQVLVLFGKPDEIDARIGTQRPGGRVDDFYDIRLQYKDFHVIVKSSYLVREAGSRYILHGTQGSFVTPAGIDPQEQALKDKKIPGSSGWGTYEKEQWGKLNTTLHGLHVEGKIETIPGNYMGFYQNLYEVIRAETREGTSLDLPELSVKPGQARDVIALIESAYESNRLRRAVKL